VSQQKRVAEAYVQLPVQDCHVSDFLLSRVFGLWGVKVLTWGMSYMIGLDYIFWFITTNSSIRVGLGTESLFRQVLA
jgi:hypothetical protein